MTPGTNNGHGVFVESPGHWKSKFRMKSGARRRPALDQDDTSIVLDDSNPDGVALTMDHGWPCSLVLGGREVVLLLPSNSGLPAAEPRAIRAPGRDRAGLPQCPPRGPDGRWIRLRSVRHGDRDPCPEHDVDAGNRRIRDSRGHGVLAPGHGCGSDYARQRDLPDGGRAVDACRWHFPAGPGTRVLRGGWLDVGNGRAARRLEILESVEQYGSDGQWVDATDHGVVLGDPTPRDPVVTGIVDGTLVREDRVLEATNTLLVGGSAPAVDALPGTAQDWPACASHHDRGCLLIGGRPPLRRGTAADTASPEPRAGA